MAILTLMAIMDMMAIIAIIPFLTSFDYQKGLEHSTGGDEKNFRVGVNKICISQYFRF